MTYSTFEWRSSKADLQRLTAPYGHRQRDESRFANCLASFGREMMGLGCLPSSHPCPSPNGKGLPPPPLAPHPTLRPSFPAAPIVRPHVGVGGFAGPC